MARYNDRTYRRTHRARGKKRSGVFPAALLLVSCIAALFVLGWCFYAGWGGALPAGSDAYAVFPQGMSDKEVTAEITASNACVADMDSGTLMYQKAADERIAPASTAKLLTALTLLDCSDPEETVTVGPEIRRAAEDASTAWLNEGDTLTVRQLLTALLLPSGGDAAYTAAVYAGRNLAGVDASEEQALDTFMQAMNRKAAQLGAKSSVFVNPDGYDADGQYTTAADLMCIAKACVMNGAVMDIAGSYSVYDRWENGREVNYLNTNELLNPASPYYCPGAIGLKTGSSAAAGSCLVSAAVMDGRTYVSVVMGSVDEERFSDTLHLFGQIGNNGYAV